MRRPLVASFLLGLVLSFGGIMALRAALANDEADTGVRHCCCPYCEGCDPRTCDCTHCDCCNE